MPSAKVMCFVQDDELADCERVRATPKMEVVGRLPCRTRAGTISLQGCYSARIVGGLTERQDLGLEAKLPRNSSCTSWSPSLVGFGGC